MMKTRHALLALALLLAACTPAPTPATPTVVLPTLTPTPTPAPTDTPEPTTATPQVWEIWFEGFSCEGSSICGPGPGLENKFYSIKSDGTDLKQLDVDSFPSLPETPAGAPVMVTDIGLVSPPKLSRDGSRLMYFGQDLKLYVIDLVALDWKILFDSGLDQALVGPFCWSSDEQLVRFVEIWRSRELRAPIVHQVDADGQNRQQLFALSGLEGAWFGDCSPDGREIVMSVPSQNAASGLYVVNLITGEWKPILPNYHTWFVRAVSTK